ncbi:spermidine Putrescine ABC transporter permease component potC [Halarchaeum acidiphilum MH1-52-1]|uniref:Spermidine Putrescine ABC transporter permease component potC n=1 Tax=Halarchaeum acidiphilum MH1-52-1 TaxID=1261545 RepID=U2YDU1_9EURY|nr:ABC transporter permease [Halarchaeum acidiphilum]GAD51851.1 spermidine Putrescine ABC transporter permease component potC [Halarchaeum acidiphilum MH1-52-1]
MSALNRLKSGIEGGWLGGWTALVYVFLYTPIVVIVAFSFEKGEFSTLPWTGFTLHWYSKLFATDIAMNAIYNSLYVAVVVAVVGTALGTLGAVGYVRYDFRGKRLFDGLITTPMTVPGLILGIALLIWFHLIGLNTSLNTVIIGQLVFVVPFVVVTVSSSLRQFDVELEEAARDLGASRWTTYRRVTFPLILPGIISGMLFAFSLSFDDFLIAFFTSGVQNTLPIYIFSKIGRGVTPVLNAISTLALVVSFLLVFSTELIQRYI